MRVQWGHALKEAGRAAEAEAAYRSALDLQPNGETCLHLGHALKLQGRTSEAVDAYARALELEPDLTAARDELLALGARHRLGASHFGQSATTELLAALSANLEAGRRLLDELAVASTYPVEAYDAFRKAYPIAPPPARISMDVSVVVDAADAAPVDVRTTLSSILDQSLATWRVVVTGRPDLADHPVGTFGVQDTRVRFGEAPAGSGAAEATVLLSAGTRLEPEALAWLAWAADRTGADAVYADHDHLTRDWRRGPTYSAPCFYGAPDPRDLETTPEVPAVLWIRGDALVSAGATTDARRKTLVDALQRSGRIVHLPRLLTSLTTHGRCTQSVAEQVRDAAAPAARLLVVIPTRDRGELLTRAVSSLRDTAARPDRLEFIVIDNRSTDAETLATFRRLRGDGIAVQSADEPFNWSRLNNQAVAGRQADVLIFANNDVEMRTHGWDLALDRLFADPQVGAVGARLHYPDGTIQHAGMILGAVDGRPLHEGVGANPTASGPLGRWRRDRAAAAVTGAFLAVSRSAFDRVGGFDERLAVAYNDVDLCLRIRAAGLSVVMAGGIELTHRESATRGRNDTRERVAWDDSELVDLYDTWGDELMRDPSLNPHWAASETDPFNGYRNPSLSRILDWIDRTSDQPWRVRRGA